MTASVIAAQRAARRRGYPARQPPLNVAERATGLGCRAGQPLLNVADKRLGFVPGEHA